MNQAQLFPKKLVIAGGSGAIGRALIASLPKDEWEVVVLTRSPGMCGGGVREIAWDGCTQGRWATELDGAVAVVNLAGRNIDCRLTKANRKAVLRSRVDSTHAIGEAIQNALMPPEVWVNASAMAYYGDVGGRVCLENSPRGRGFLAEVCQGWEAAQTSLETPKTRQVRLRISVVLDRYSGALPKLKQLAHFALGGAVGSGKQAVSWIHMQDMVDIIHFAIDAPSAEGAYNCVAPGAVTNKAFQRTLRKVLGEWVGLWAPAFAVKLGAWLMGSNGQLALMGARLVPKRLQRAEFEFSHPELEGALRDLLGKHAAIEAA
ncbi:MAG: TIGR01777 family oxidoreductase [Planctomycetes bacterium]|nr:TIGR01777 family oxidoreductase [Planctomycetota bacterium]